MDLQVKIVKIKSPIVTIKVTFI